ncbi:MAG: fused MFS/spermidine synthase [Acidobacteria bacterium]|nr:fused MFS/spermidine synthase [Acidobacteriota bacterium]
MAVLDVTAPPAAAWQRILYGAAIFLGAGLLFLIEPVLAKAILPRFGGSAGVWTTCMLFYQVVLLAGYLYAHWLSRFFSHRAQATIHVGLLALSLVLMPVAVPVAPPRSEPLIEILALLASSIGLPFLLLSSTSPLLQSWFHGSAGGAFPYRLYAVSNTASLVALLAYPFAIEPALALRTQFLAWSAGYAAFALLAAAAALGIYRARGRTEPEPAAPVARSTRAAWLLLAACPAILWITVANRLSLSVAAIPFLWVLPLSIYLLSLILCFHSGRWYQPRLYRWLVPPALIALSIVLVRTSAGIARERGFEWALAAFSICLFVCCMFCHGELARRKPLSGGATVYYLTLAAGGAAGAVFVGLVAPLIFRDYLELPFAIVLCLCLAIALLFGLSSRKMIARLVVTCAAAFIVGVLPGARDHRVHARNFYGALEVTESGTLDDRYRSLYNGSILHGIQAMAADKRKWATTYYGPESGAGLAIRSRTPGPAKVGVVGLGVGTLAAYARPGDVYRFYEINPLVATIAKHEFRYLAEAAGKVDVVVGDGRIALEREQPGNFDVLVIDAFSGDAIPIHLLTVEAFRLYRRHLKKDGIIAVHITNKYIDLSPVLERVANEIGYETLLVRNSSDPARHINFSEWIVLTSNLSFIGRHMPQVWRPATRRGLRLWTDDYSNLLAALR